MSNNIQNDDSHDMTQLLEEVPDAGVDDSTLKGKLEILYNQRKVSSATYYDNQDKRNKFKSVIREFNETKRLRNLVTDRNSKVEK